MNIENLTPDEEIIHKLGGQIKRLQNRLEVSEKEHYKTLQQLAIATKALKEYAELETIGQEARQALKEIDMVGTSMSLEKEKE